ncbi:hypothetical protein BIWAKO_05523 [Bosea sp. BIWAKO-01]|nr:hypothetical protein BIWAKO_05523 [Bosea sp. BIWAKO-01]
MGRGDHAVARKQRGAAAMHCQSSLRPCPQAGCDQSTVRRQGQAATPSFFRRCRRSCMHGWHGRKAGAMAGFSSKEPVTRPPREFRDHISKSM